MDLQLPDRRKPTDSSFNTSPESIRAWVDDLPLINSRESRALLDVALTEINALDLSPESRYEALELLATSVNCVIEGMKKVFLTSPLPLSSHNMLLATQTLELCNRMAIGYRVLADNPGSDAARTVAIHRSLRYLSKMLLINYQLYIQYPEDLWKTLNTLFILAEQYDITAHSVTDTTLSTHATSTISTVYKQILLLSLACPYRLRQKEIHFVYNALMDWADTTRLYSIDNPGAHGLFAINLNADNPPSYLALNDADTRDQHWRILDTTSMADRIRVILDKHPGNANHYTGIGDTDILQRLTLAWGVMPKRRFTRHARSARVHLVVGLNAIHQRITVPEKETDNKDDAFDDQHYLQDPTFETVTRIRQNRADLTSEKQVRKSELDQGTGKHHAESWKMTNISAGGYCLLWDSDESSSARVGELVAIIEQDSIETGAWNMGVVRWMKYTEAHGLELGIQMLSPGGQAVWAYLDDASVRSGKKAQGILLPEIKALGQQVSLLLPTLPFHAGCIATLQDAGTLGKIRLTRRLENTGSFAQYHYTATIDS